MTDIKSKVQGINASITPKNIKSVIGETNNIYEAINVLATRARQLSVEVKEELHHKLGEFAVTSDTIEEIHENKEQIEISKFYERMPNPAVIATEEFLNDELEFRYRDTEVKDSDTEA